MAAKKQITSREFEMLKKRHYRCSAGDLKIEEITAAIAGALSEIDEVGWDAEAYPSREAWDIAVERVKEMKKYALRYHAVMRERDLRLLDLEWMYENVGMKEMLRRRDVRRANGIRLSGDPPID